MQAHTERLRRFTALTSRRFDLLVVGGGITGCGIAHSAARRGLSVALVEQADFASGTSSRSSRLIHGGVRYLEHGHLHLVFESSAERRRLLKLAPHLVRPLEFTWPVYEGARIPRWKLGAGLMLYDALALFRNVGRHHRLSRQGVLDHEPRLLAQGLRGGATYFDARTNDSRLTITNAIAATEAGALLVNHARAAEPIVEGRRTVGMRVHDMLTGQSPVDVRASVIVNATGPWNGTVHGSKGAHIAVPRERIGNRNALTLLHPTDGRVLFVLPSGPNAIVGTTETEETEGQQSPDTVRATNDDVQYLLNAANAFFPTSGLSTNDVVAAWAGIRPLVPTSGSAGAATREHAITTRADGVITISGGKLTTYRIMAGQVVDDVLRTLGRTVGPWPTDTAVLPGGDIGAFDSVVARLADIIGDEPLATHLVSNYGSRWPGVWAEIEKDDGSLRVVDGLPYTIGELRYGVRHEFSMTLGDLLIRRTHVGFEARDHGLSVAGKVARAVGGLLGWDGAALDAAVGAFEVEVGKVFSVE